MKQYLLLMMVMAGALLMACSRDDNAPKGNAVYYWRTVFRLSPAERMFLSNNNIEAIYVKFFDVVADGNELRPEATLRFADRFPEGVEIVPTVFIDSRAMDRVSVLSALPQMLLSRVDSMMVKNGYAPAGELQVDFDWTPSNRERYFALLMSLRRLLHAQHRRLSTTLRLHQLNQPAPPVDYGALMVYNIGNFANPDESNSIISVAALKPYLPALKDYTLPLATALPVYNWNLLFHNGQFMVIARGINESDTALFIPVGANRFTARRYMPVPSASTGAPPGGRIYPGDLVRHEEASAALLDSVAREIEKAKPSALNRIILYHLDENSLNNYTNHEIKEIYRHP